MRTLGCDCVYLNRAPNRGRTGTQNKVKSARNFSLFSWTLVIVFLGHPEPSNRPTARQKVNATRVKIHKSVAKHARPSPLKLTSARIVRREKFKFLSLSCVSWHAPRSRVASWCRSVWALVPKALGWSWNRAPTNSGACATTSRGLQSDAHKS